MPGYLIPADVVPTSITVNNFPVAAARNFGIGEPLNSAEKGNWTVTATYAGGVTETLQKDDPRLSWTPANFSATAATNISVTVSYKGINAAAITGINVQTLVQRINAVLANSSATIYLYTDETTTASTSINNKNITLIGVNAERTIKRSNEGKIFNLSSGGQLTLENNVTIDGSGVILNNDALILVLGNSTLLTIKDGAKIVNNYNNSNSIEYSGGVSVRNGGHLIMEGGEISGNTCIWEPGGVYLYDGTLTMYGGKITGNTSVRSNGDDVYASQYGVINLSGNSQLGDVIFTGIFNSLDSYAYITVSNDFKGSILSLGLSGDSSSSIARIKMIWTDYDAPVIKPATGFTLTKVLLDRFTLSNFLYSNGSYREPISPGYHLYGTRADETDTARFGTLVAD